MITERSGYVLQGADVNLFLAQYALEQEKDKAKAKEYAESALKLAYCDGPPYYYKVAYEEAERMLEITCRTNSICLRYSCPLMEESHEYKRRTSAFPCGWTA